MFSLKPDPDMDKLGYIERFAEPNSPDIHYRFDSSKHHPVRNFIVIAGITTLLLVELAMMMTH